MISYLIRGIGIFAPGLKGMKEAAPVLKGLVPWQNESIKLPSPDLLPPNERRRSSDTVRLALAVSQEAIQSSGLDPKEMLAVFASSDGDGKITQQLCEAFWDPNGAVSPTRFGNSVHNAPAGYYSISVGSMKPSTSISSGDFTFLSGLLEATLLAETEKLPVLLSAYDIPFPEPLQKINPVSMMFGVSLTLEALDSLQEKSVPQSLKEGQAVLSIVSLHSEKEPTPGSLPEEIEKSGNRIVRSAPLFKALASPGEHTVVLPFEHGNRVELLVQTGPR